MSDQDDSSPAPASALPRFLASPKNCAPQPTPEERLEGLIELLVGMVPPERADAARELGEHVLETARSYANETTLRGCVALLDAVAADQRAAKARHEAAERFEVALERWMERIVTETPEAVH